MLVVRPNSTILLVGEFPGEDDVNCGIPFMGSSGGELGRMLQEVGLSRNECSITMVLKERPEGGKIDSVCLSKKEAEAEYVPKEGWPKKYPWPAIAQGKYLHPRLLHYLDTLADEIQSIRPNVVVALGRIASWALVGSAAISQVRGAIAESWITPGIKVLPTYSPAHVMKDWSARPIVMADLIKAKYHSTFPEIRRMKRELWLEPTIEDLWYYKKHYLDSAQKISYDIEASMARRILTCLGFAPSPTQGIVVPFVDKRKPGYSFYTEEEEIEVWRWVAEVMNLPAAKVAQNGKFDMRWIWGLCGIPLYNAGHDTMLKHHALYPELPKSLGFLASVYADEASWKLMRKSSDKSDDEEE